MTRTEQSACKPSSTTASFATLRALLHLNGTGAPSPAPSRKRSDGARSAPKGCAAARRGYLRFTLLLALTAALALALAAPAFASREHEFTTTFATKCLAEPGCTGAELFSPDGVAVNEASGDVYVVDKGEAGVGGRVVRFNKAGVFQSETTGPNATGMGTLTEGSATITGVLKSTGAFTVGEEVTATGLLAGTTITAVEGGGETLQLSQAASESEFATLTAQQSFEKPETLAVDNSCALRIAADPELTQAACEAEDPSNGDVYVVDAGRRVLDKFTAAGEYVGQIAEAQFQEEGLEGVAVDPNGTVWVSQEVKAFAEFTNGATNKFVPPRILAELAAGGFASSGLAVDSKGNFYGAVHPHSQPQVAKWDHTGKNLIESLDGEGSTGIAVNQADDDPLVVSASSVAVFDPEGNLLERLGEEGGAKHLTQGAGIGVNASLETLYVADAATGEIVVFGLAKPTTPKVEGESFKEVDSSSATLGGEVNPRSEPGEPVTEYHFQYGRCTTLDPASCAGSGYEAEVPVPDGQIPADFSVHSVSAHITGLQPAATYHFRLVAKNSHGQGAPGEDRTFTTQGAGGPLALPDNRGWELVSPPDKQGALIKPIAEVGVVQAAASGDAVTYLTNAPTEAQPQGAANESQILSTRAPGSWSSRDIAIPHAGPTGAPLGEGPEFKFFDPELTLSALQPYGEFNPALSAEASESTAYLHSISPSCGSACYRPLVTGKAGFANVPTGTHFGEEEHCLPSGVSNSKTVCGPRFRGATDDLTHVVLSLGPDSEAALTPGAAPGGLYEWSVGTLALVSVLPGPGHEPTAGELGFEASQAARHAISTDGSRIVWHTPLALYLRDSARGETVQLDRAEAACEAAAECTSGGGQFQIASADASRVFFTDTSRLTKTSGAAENHPDLYECAVVVTAEKLTCELTDLSPVKGTESGDVRGGVLGASEDGSYLYFVAKGVLSETPNAQDKKATANRPNLYLRHGTTTTFITTLAAGDEHDFDEEAGQYSALLYLQPTRASASGRFLELMSQAPLMGYDNRDRATGKPVAEVYLYDAASNQLRCASCEPTGVRPVGVEELKLETGSGGLVVGRAIWPQNALVAANVPGWTNEGGEGAGTAKSRYQPRYLNDEGRLFFNTADALVPQDSNGTQDVYEYEPPGVGDCTEASSTFSPRSGGCVSLISSGASSQESAFLDASESGNDVFFLTSARLSALDTDTSRDVYDAHVCTGASPCITYTPTQTSPCIDEASCKAPSPPQPSIFGAPASATFQGPGNPTSATPPPAKPKTAAQIRAEHLKKALKACKKDKKKSKRQACEKQARKRYGPLKKAKKSSHTSNTANDRRAK